MLCNANRLSRKQRAVPAALCKSAHFWRWLECASSFCVLSFQCVPGGGGGRTSTQSTRHGRDPTLLPSSHSLPERHAPQLAVLLYCSVPRHRHPLPTAVHCGRQQDLQRLLERPTAASEKLQHLLPGCQHSQRGGCFFSDILISYKFKLSVAFKQPSSDAILCAFILCYLAHQLKFQMETYVLGC